MISTGRKRGQRDLEFHCAPVRRMQMSKGARLTVANQKQVHHLAVVRNERRPLALLFRGVHLEN